MDFFSSHHLSQSSASSGVTIDSFAQEIGRRFSLPQTHPVLTSRLSPHATTTSTTTTTLPPALSVCTPQAKLVSLSLRSQPPTPQPEQPDTSLLSVDPSTLLPILATPQVLVLDLRPHATYTQSRLPHALSLSVPSTLLKRPAFSLEKLTDMLPSSSCRRRFSAWKHASRILVYDADSQAIPEGSNIRGLLRKFQKEGFDGELAWLKGGFAGVWREQRSLVDDGPPSPDSSGDEDFHGCYLRAKKLPSSAFQQASTTSAAKRPQPTSPCRQQNLVAPPPTSTRPVAANPFYDNIRQNRELEHGITERIPLRLPASVVARRDDLPFDWLKDIINKADAEEGTEAIAMQFYMIELREQRRLMGIMDHHSREADSVREPPKFPYSITAGVEKGSKNRYHNIWPFEHARVRLNVCNMEDGSDYINASYIQPLCTRRRYIATQGPLPTTFTDFWTLCWEQNIRIIVMLTKQMEGSTEKCGCYWKLQSYGPLRLELVSSSGEEEVHPVPSHCGFDFGPSSGLPDHNKAIIRRTFLLSHTEHPEHPPRKVTQLQYLAWPDFDVPGDPRGLLNLMREVDVLRSESDSEDSASSDPVLLHCSAGIGRTGGFIVADAVLDGIRREIRKARAGSSKRPDYDTIRSVMDPRNTILTTSPGPMDLDGTEADKDNPCRFSSGHKPALPIPRLDGASVRCRASSSGPSAHGTTSSSSSRSALCPSTSTDVEMSMPRRRDSVSMPLLWSLVPPSADPKVSVTPTLNTSRSSSASNGSESSGSTSTTHFPSISSGSLSLTDKSTAPTSSISVSVASSRPTSPAKDTEQMQNSATFDYTDPRRLHDNTSPDFLSDYDEPVRSILEDMREQRMSLCQSLRQYVFVHRVIVEGALDIVDEERAAAQQGDGSIKVKRGPSPTELLMEDGHGAVKLSKRPSFKRRAHSDVSNVTGRMMMQ